ncbi:MAG: hemerythrin family protein [Pseudomonadota bacterium]
MIDFNHMPRVAVGFMNDDHTKLMLLLNELSAQLASYEQANSGAERVAHAFEEVLAHSRAHFAQEQALMEQYDFPPYHCHRGEHERVLAEMEAELTAWNAARDPARLKHYVGETVPKWFVNHLETMDYVTAMFLAQHGVQ